MLELEGSINESVEYGIAGKINSSWMDDSTDNTTEKKSLENTRQTEVILEEDRDDEKKNENLDQNWKKSNQTWDQEWDKKDDDWGSETKNQNEGWERNNHGHGSFRGGRGRGRGGRGRPMMEISGDHDRSENPKIKEIHSERNNLEEEICEKSVEEGPQRLKDVWDDDKKGEEQDWGVIVAEQVDAADLKGADPVLKISKREVIPSRSVSRHRADRKDYSGNYQNGQNFRGRSRTPGKSYNEHFKKDEFWSGFDKRESRPNNSYQDDYHTERRHRDYRGGGRRGQGYNYSNRYYEDSGEVNNRRTYRRNDYNNQGYGYNRDRGGYRQRDYYRGGEGNRRSYQTENSEWSRKPHETVDSRAKHTESNDKEAALWADNDNNGDWGDTHSLAPEIPKYRDRSKSAVRESFDERPQRSRTPTRYQDRSRSAVREYQDPRPQRSRTPNRFNDQNDRSLTPSRRPEKRSSTPGFSSSQIAEIDRRYGYTPDNPEVYNATFKPSIPFQNYENQSQNYSEGSHYNDHHSSRGRFDRPNPRTPRGSNFDNNFNEDNHHYSGRGRGQRFNGSYGRGGFRGNDDRYANHNHYDSGPKPSEPYDEQRSQGMLRGGRGRPLHDFSSSKRGGDNWNRDGQKETTRNQNWSNEHEMNEEKEKPTKKDDWNQDVFHSKVGNSDSLNDSKQNNDDKKSSASFKDIYGNNCTEIELNWDEKPYYKPNTDKKRYETGTSKQMKTPFDDSSRSSRSASKGRHKLNETHSNFKYMPQENNRNQSRNEDGSSKNLNDTYDKKKSRYGGQSHSFKKGSVKDYFHEESKSSNQKDSVDDSIPHNRSHQRESRLDESGQIGGIDNNITFGKDDSICVDGMGDQEANSSILSKEFRQQSAFDRNERSPVPVTRGTFSGGNRGRRGR